VHEPAPDADVIPQRPRLLGSPERRVLEVMDGVRVERAHMAGRQWEEEMSGPQCGGPNGASTECGSRGRKRRSIKDGLLRSRVTILDALDG
jgi:hypothetical protein